MLKFHVGSHTFILTDEEWTRVQHAMGDAPAVEFVDEKDNFVNVRIVNGAAFITEFNERHPNARQGTLGQPKSTQGATLA